MSTSFCPVCHAPVLDDGSMDFDPTAPLPDEELAAIEACVWRTKTSIRDGSPTGRFVVDWEEAEADRRTLLAALRAERTAPLDVERLARALAYGVDRQLGPGSAIAFDVAIGAAVVEYARLAQGHR